MFAQAAEPNFWLQWLQIVWLDLLLAGDNAVVIALAVRSLPHKEQRLGRLWGTAGAAGLRVLFLALAGWMMSVPLLKAIGGLVLVWIAWKLIWPRADHGDAGNGDAGGDGKSRAGGSLGEAIKIIVIADVSMSIDNVFAVAGAAHGDLKVAALGIAISIPMVVWGSSLLSKLMSAHPWIVWIGGGVLGYVAGSLILEDEQVIAWTGGAAHPSFHPLQLVLGIGFAALGWWGHRLRVRRERARNG